MFLAKTKQATCVQKKFSFVGIQPAGPGLGAGRCAQAFFPNPLTRDTVLSAAVASRLARQGQLVSPRVSVDPTTPCEESRTKFSSLLALEGNHHGREAKRLSRLEAGFLSLGDVALLPPHRGLPLGSGGGTLSVGLAVTGDCRSLPDPTESCLSSSGSGGKGSGWHWGDSVEFGLSNQNDYPATSE